MTFVFSSVNLHPQSPVMSFFHMFDARLKSNWSIVFRFGNLVLLINLSNLLFSRDITSLSISLSKISAIQIHYMKDVQKNRESDKIHFRCVSCMQNRKEYSPKNSNLTVISLKRKFVRNIQSIPACSSDGWRSTKSLDTMIQHSMSAGESLESEVKLLFKDTAREGNAVEDIL